MGRASFLAMVATVCLCAFSASQSDGYVREHYTKYEYLVPVRDGVSLFTSVYAPKDHSRQYPIMMSRTPYSVAPYGVDNYRTSLGPSEHFMRGGFIFVYQDVRGRYMSEGEWVEVRPQVANKRGPSDIDESTDTYDSIDWLVKHVPGNNGRVGIWGVSYGGFYTAAGIIDSHPALKAASPQAPIGDYFMGDDSFHNGAFMLAANFGFYRFFSERKDGPARPGGAPPFEVDTPDGYNFFLRMGPLSNSNSRYFKGGNPYWNLNLDHVTYDEFWKARAIVRNLKGVKPGVLTVGGWFDAEDLAGPLGVYRAIEASSPGISNSLVMGPWTHGSWSRGDGDRVGNLDFGSKTSAYFREKIEFPFFTRILKETGGNPEPEARVFVTGLNEWREYQQWPPPDTAARTLYFLPGGGLGPDAPTGDNDAYDEYVSDPDRPVPYLGYVAMGMTRDYMTEDQRFAATRPDVLVYQTDVLKQDLTVAGPVKARLFVSTTGTDSDWVVKLIDVYPDDFPQPKAPEKEQPPQNTVRMGGYQQLVRGEPFRGKFRSSFEKPAPFVPGKPERIEYVMPDIGHCFRRGHRVMVQVQSSWFPLVDRNPQTFCNIPNAKEADFRKATQRVHRSRTRPSAISFQVLP